VKFRGSSSMFLPNFEADGCVGDGRRRGRASSLRAAFRILAPMTLGPEGNCSAFSAWQSATPAYDSPDSSVFVFSGTASERGQTQVVVPRFRPQREAIVHQ
jgi:hypothetical protein